MRNILSTGQNSGITALALGKFDGMHRAHSEILSHLGEGGALLCIEDNLGEKLTPEKSLYTHYPIISVPFNAIKNIDGKIFMQMLENAFPSLRRLVVGYDFCFGKNRAYCAKDLKILFKNEVIIVPECRHNGLGVHSSTIRDLIIKGEMTRANALLGRHYAVRGGVIGGQKLGAKTLYPTININPSGFLLPQSAVYASFTRIGDKKGVGGSDIGGESETMPSVSFVGNRLSTDNAFSVETHILDRDLRVDSGAVEIEFVRKMRENRVFANLSDLKEQISTDIALARGILADLGE